MNCQPKNMRAGSRLPAKLMARRRLSRNTFELILTRPSGFSFVPGQRIRFLHEAIERDYSLISDPDDDNLALCVRRVSGGRFSPYLTSLQVGSHLTFSGPCGYFVFQPSERPALFVATGTGIAPFLSMARSGVTGFCLLHGVASAEDLYYEDFWQKTAEKYIKCLSGTPSDTSRSPHTLHCNVTEYVNIHLPRKPYDFYLCGREDMIRDVIYLVDEFFPGSLVRTEIYF